jgi:hypothetical protein
METLTHNLVAPETAALKVGRCGLGRAFGAAVGHGDPLRRTETVRGAVRTVRTAREAASRGAHARDAAGAEAPVALRNRSRASGTVFVLRHRRLPFGHVDVRRGG